MSEQIDSGAVASEPIVSEEVSDAEGQAESTEPSEPPKGQLSTQNNNALKDMIRELELNVNGKKIKKKIDLSDEAALVREFQIAAANQNGMAKAAEYEKLFQQEMEKLRGDPLEYAAKILGIDAEDLAAQRLSRSLEERQKSPEQKASEERAKEVERLRQENDQFKRKAEEESLLRAQEREATNFQREMSEALEKYPSLPKNSKLVNDKIIDMMLWAIDRGASDVTVEKVLPYVEAELIAQLNAHMDALPEDVAEKYIGNRTSERLRNKRLDTMKKGTGITIPETTRTAEAIATAESAKKRTGNSRDYFRNLK